MPRAVPGRDEALAARAGQATRVKVLVRSRVPMKPMPRETRTHRIPRKPRRDSTGSVKRSAETRADANCHRERRRCLDRKPLPRRGFQSPLLGDRSKSRRGSRYDPRPRWSRDTHPTELRTAVAPACLRDNPRGPTGSSVRAPKDLRHRRDFDARRVARFPPHQPGGS